MTTRLLNNDIANQVREALSQMKDPVQILYFGRQEGCETCEDTLQLAREVAELSAKITLGVYDVAQDADLARQHNVDKLPGLVIAGWDGSQVMDYGVRYAGIPSGYEFSSLIQDLLLVSSRDSGLSPKTRQALLDIKKPVHLQVFVTPT